MWCILCAIRLFICVLFQEQGWIPWLHSSSRVEVYCSWQWDTGDIQRWERRHRPVHMLGQKHRGVLCHRSSALCERWMHLDEETLVVTLDFGVYLKLYLPHGRSHSYSRGPRGPADPNRQHGPALMPGRVRQVLQRRLWAPVGKRWCRDSP